MSNNWKNGWRIEGSSAIKTFDADDRGFETLEDLMKRQGIDIYKGAKGIHVDIDYSDTQDKTVTLPKDVLSRLKKGEDIKDLALPPSQEKAHALNPKGKKPRLRIFDEVVKPMFAKKEDQKFVENLVEQQRLQSVFVTLQQDPKADKYTVSLVTQNISLDEGRRLAKLIFVGTSQKFKVQEKDGKVTVSAEFMFNEMSKNRNSVSNCAFLTSKMLGVGISNMSDLRLNEGIEISDRGKR